MSQYPKSPQIQSPTLEDILDALRSVRVDLASYEAEQAGEDFEPGSIEISEGEIAYIRWYRERNRG